MRAVIYVRQSKDSEKNGLAVERQLADCRKLAATKGLTVVAELPDNDTSASDGKVRKGYQEVLGYIDRKATDYVIAWHVDRLTRRLSELEDLITRCEATGVRVATVSGDLDLSTDAGRLVGRILASVARGEVERKSARQKRAARQFAESGAAPKRRAFGFTNGAHDPVEAPALVDLYDKVLSGMSLLAATRWLNEQGHRTTTGKPWDRSSVRKMLLNPRNKGRRAYQGEDICAGDWEPIVSEDVWQATYEMLTDSSRARPDAARGRTWLGGGLFECYCGSKVRVNYTNANSRIYACKASSHMGRTADRVDEVVKETMVRLLADKRLPGRLNPTSAAETRELRAKAKRLRDRLEEIEDDYTAGEISKATYKRLIAKTEENLDPVREKLSAVGKGSALATVLDAHDPGQAWLDADLGIQQEVLDAVATVTILRAPRPGARFDPETVIVEPRYPA